MHTKCYGNVCSSVNNIQSTGPCLEAGDKAMNKTKSLPSEGLRFTAQEEVPIYLRKWGGGGGLQSRISELGTEV